jgi:shikimate dehydrogenase
MKVYGLLGKSLGYSYSPKIFEEKFLKKGIKGEYRLFETDNLDNLPQLVENNKDLEGFNVTVPYKQSVVSYLDKLSPEARVTGSVNVVKVFRKRDGYSLKGYNTDAYAFEKTLKPLVASREHIRALILGTGGTAHTVAFVLRKLGIYFYFVSRKPVKIESLRYSWLDNEIMKTSNLIINTTPLGTYPNVDECPEIPYELLTKDHILYDVVYNPAETLFLKKGREHGATTKNGLEMLYLQAERSWTIWNNRFFF